MSEKIAKIDYHIALIGFSGTGKTTIGEILKQQLQIPLLETDETIVRQNSMSINQIFENYGEEYFRDLETQLLRSELSTSPKIISTGGGIVERKINREILNNKAVTISLLASPREILRRLEDAQDRPLLNENDRLAKIEKLLKRRQKWYENAHYLIDTDGKTPQQVADEILIILNTSF